MKREIDWQKGDGLVPAIVVDGDGGQVLMMAYMNAESLKETERTGHVTFFSRSRQRLWTKGETSGHFLDFLDLQVDCDGDALLIRARPHGPVCHEGTDTCFGNTAPQGLEFLSRLTQVIERRFVDSDREKSYVAKLIDGGLDRMAQKVGEEAVETVIASKNSDMSDFEGEAADLLFHLMVLLRAKGSSLTRLAQVLASRHRG